MAPVTSEQAQGLPVDVRSDQFTFGVILYQIASGNRPFKRASAAETMAAIIREEPEPLPGGVPQPLRWLIVRWLSKYPRERYDSTRDLYRELCQVREHLSDTTAPEKQGRRRASLIAAAVAMASG